MRRPALVVLAIAGAAVVAALPVAGGLVWTPARAATTPTVTITWDGSKFSTVSKPIASGTIVKWKNSGTAEVLGVGDGTLEVTYKSGPTSFSKITVEHNATSSGTKIVGGSKQANEVFNGHDNSGDDATGTVAVSAAPPPPSPKPSTKPPTHSPTPKPTHKTTSPTHSPSPKPSSPPLGVTNAPPLGIGVLPGPKTSVQGPGPQVAAPDDIEPSLQPPVPSEDVPHVLGQPVPARKYGLPGALAAVLLAGVAVGVVRAARTEVGNGNGNGNGTFHNGENKRRH